jgi:anti-anti-sigma regulatory factor
LPVIVSFDAHPPVLRCSGDEDRTTQSLRRRPLSQALKARTDVTVDLRDLGFADASLMLDLAMLARRLRKCDRLLRVRNAQPHIQVLIEYVGLHRLEGVMVESQHAPA